MSSKQISDKKILQIQQEGKIKFFLEHYKITQNFSLAAHKYSFFLNTGAASAVFIAYKGKYPFVILAFTIGIIFSLFSMGLAFLFQYIENKKLEKFVFNSRYKNRNFHYYSSHNKKTNILCAFILFLSYLSSIIGGYLLYSGYTNTKISTIVNIFITN